MSDKRTDEPWTVVWWHAKDDFGIPPIPIDRPLITDKYQVFLVEDDNMPILFTGINTHGERVLGTTVQWFMFFGERHFQIILTDSVYEDYLAQRISYLDLLKAAEPLYVVDVFDGNSTVYATLLADVPKEYWPSSDTYFNKEWS